MLKGSCSTQLHALVTICYGNGDDDDEPSCAQQQQGDLRSLGNCSVGGVACVASVVVRGCLHAICTLSARAFVPHAAYEQSKYIDANIF